MHKKKNHKRIYLPISVTLDSFPLASLLHLKLIFKQQDKYSKKLRTKTKEENKKRKKKMITKLAPFVFLNTTGTLFSLIFSLPLILTCAYMWIVQFLNPRCKICFWYSDATELCFFKSLWYFGIFFYPISFDWRHDLYQQPRGCNKEQVNWATNLLLNRWIVQLNVWRVAQDIK